MAASQGFVLKGDGWIAPPIVIAPGAAPTVLGRGTPPGVYDGEKRCSRHQGAPLALPLGRSPSAAADPSPRLAHWAVRPVQLWMEPTGELMVKAVRCTPLCKPARTNASSDLAKTHHLGCAPSPQTGPNAASVVRNGTTFPLVKDTPFQLQPHDRLHLLADGPALVVDVAEPPPAAPSALDASQTAGHKRSVRRAAGCSGREPGPS